MEDKPKKHSVITWTLILLAILVAALLMVLVWFGANVRNLYRTGAFSPAFSRIHRRTMARPTMTAEQVQGWMTFRYLSYVFRLPANFFVIKFNISDPNYFNRTLDAYAKANNLSSVSFVQKVRDALFVYQGGQL